MSVADIDMKFEITFKDHTLIIKRPNFQCEGWFVDHIRQKALAACEVIPDPTTRKEAIGAVVGEIAAGKYDFDFDPDLGQANYVHDSLKTIRGIKEWLFCVLKQENLIMSTKDGRKIYDELWKDENKRNELFQKMSLFNQPNPQTPPQ